jgi:hypothetical protein
MKILYVEEIAPIVCGEKRQTEHRPPRLTNPADAVEVGWL